jgi:hypothetical protein
VFLSLAPTPSERCLTFYLPKTKQTAKAARRLLPLKLWSALGVTPSFTQKRSNSFLREHKCLNNRATENWPRNSG